MRTNDSTRDKDFINYSGVMHNKQWLEVPKPVFWATAYKTVFTCHTVSQKSIPNICD